MMKRFLVPVMALAAFGLPVGASVVTYCQISCGANDITAFNNATSGLGNATPITFTSGNVSDNGNGDYQYLDAARSNRERVILQISE